MLESNEGIDNGFCIVLGGCFFALNFYQEPEEVIEGHCSVVGVTVEYIRDVRRRFGSLRHVWICREETDWRREMRRGDCRFAGNDYKIWLRILRFYRKLHELRVSGTIVLFCYLPASYP